MDPAGRVDVAMVTMSTVRGDSRIIEEARGLAAAGWRVVVFSPRVSSSSHSIPADGDRVSFRELGVAAWLTSHRHAAPSRRRVPTREEPSGGGGAGVGHSRRLRAISRRVAEQLRVGGVRGAGVMAAHSVRARLRARIFTRAAASAVRHASPAVVHGHDLPAAYWAVTWAPVGARIVYDAHEIYEELAGMPPHRGHRYRDWQRVVAGQVDALVVANSGIGDHLRREYPQLPEPVVVRNSHAATRVAEAPSGRRTVRLDLGIPDSANLAVYIGGLSRYRGLTSIVESMQFVPEGWHIALVGTGPLRGELTKQASALPPSARERVHFVAPVPPEAVISYLRSATVGLILYEPVCINHEVATPNKLWEFAAAGLPIVASSLPALSREVEGNGLGVIVDDDSDPRKIAAALSQLTPDRLRAYADASLRFAKEDDWGTYVSRLSGVVENLVRDS